MGKRKVRRLISGVNTLGGKKDDLEMLKEA